jgi:hypothetical protein
MNYEQRATNRGERKIRPVGDRQFSRPLTLAFLALMIASACAKSTHSPANGSETVAVAGGKTEPAAPPAEASSGQRPASEVFGSPALIGPASASHEAVGKEVTVRGAVLADPSMCTKKQGEAWRAFFAQATDIGEQVCLEVIGSTLSAADAGIEFDVKGTIVQGSDGRNALQAISAVRVN